MKTYSTELTETTRTDGKIKSFVDKIGKRNVFIACAVLLIGAAVWLNFVLFSSVDQGGYGDYDQPSGNVSDNLGGNTNNGDSNGDTSVNNEDTYFSATMVSRQRARDEAIEVLQAVVDNVDASEEMKAEALAGISAIAEEIQLESNIESLILAKGFEKCVAVLNGDTASIVVSADDLQIAQIAQINAIVYEQAGIAPAGVTIIKK